MSKASANRRYALRAKARGARYSLRIAIEARRAGIPISLGFAIVEKESGFRNVFGHDPTIYAGAGRVTRSRYLRYKRARGPIGRGGMQGVGPCQLTWYSYQDAADKIGGCWKPRHNIAVGFRILGNHIEKRGLYRGIVAYNGTGPRAEAYARDVLRRQRSWSRTLTRRGR